MRLSMSKVDHVIGVKFKHGRKIRSGSLEKLSCTGLFLMLMYNPMKKLLSSWFEPSLLHLFNIYGYYLDIFCFHREQTVEILWTYNDNSISCRICWRFSYVAVFVLISEQLCGLCFVKVWKSLRMMKQANLQCTEVQLLRIVEFLGERSCWKQAISVGELVCTHREHKYNMRS